MSYFQPYKPIRKGMPVWVIILLVVIGFMALMMFVGIMTSATHTESKATATPTYTVPPVVPIAARVDTNDERFIKLIGVGDIVMQDGRDQTAIRAGHAVCDERARGLTELQVALEVQENAHLTPYKAGWFVGASESIYCVIYK